MLSSQLSVPPSYWAIRRLGSGTPDASPGGFGDSHAQSIRMFKGVCASTRRLTHGDSQCDGFDVPIILAATSCRNIKSSDHRNHRFASAPFASEVRLRGAARYHELRKRGAGVASTLTNGWSP